MSEIKNRIEKFLEKITRIIYRNRLKVLTVMLCLIGMLLWQVKYLTVDTSSEGMLHKDDPGRLIYNDFRDQFGNSSIILIGIKAPDLFSPGFLNKLKTFHEHVETGVPYVKKVTSLINARNTYGKDDVLHVGELLKDWPDKKYDLENIRAIALKNRVYKNNIISDNGQMAAVVIELEASVAEKLDEDEILDGFDDTADQDETDDKDFEEDKKEKKYYLSSKEVAEIVDAIEKIINEYNSSDFYLASTGGPIIVGTYNKITREGFASLLLYTNLIVLVFLFILFRRMSGMILPVVIVELALFTTLGFMGLFDLSITIFSIVLPNFLIAVGIADSVHILAIFYRRYSLGDGKEDAIAFAVGHSGLAVAMTSLTTAVGLLSFSFSELSALAELGIIAASGVMLAFIYTIILLPALISIISIKIRISKKPAGNGSFKAVNPGVMDRILLGFANFSTSHPRKIVAVCFILFLLSTTGLFNMKFSHSLLTYFPDELKVRGDSKLIDREFNGSLVLEVIVDTEKENGLYDPEIINRIEEFTSNISDLDKGIVYAGKVFSINDILKETNQSLHGNDSKYYDVPKERSEIAQELLLFEGSGSDDLERIVDNRLSKTRISIKLPWVDLVLIDEYMSALEKRLKDLFKDRAQITITGMTAIMGRTIPAAILSMTKSYILAFIVITILMIMLVGNFRYGIISMFPNLLPIVIVMGIMAYLEIPLDMTALMIGSIAIGLVVDDTMHFMYNYTKYLEITGSVRNSVRETLLGTGRAILITSLVLAANFFTLLTASLKSTMTFGFFTGIVILLALLSDFVLAPALMAVFKRKKENRL